MPWTTLGVVVAGVVMRVREEEEENGKEDRKGSDRARDKESFPAGGPRYHNSRSSLGSNQGHRSGSCQQVIVWRRISWSIITGNARLSCCRVKDEVAYEVSY